VSVYYVTFGVKYADEPHPVNEIITNRAVVAIEAPSEEFARRVAFHHFDQYWSQLLPEEEGRQYAAKWGCYTAAHVFGQSIVWAGDTDTMLNLISTTQTVPREGATS